MTHILRLNNVEGYSVTELLPAHSVPVMQLDYGFFTTLGGLVLSEPAGQCDLLAFSMQKFFPRGKKDGRRKMHIRHIKVCQCVLQKGEKFTAGITVATFSLMVGRDYYPETVRHFL